MNNKEYGRYVESRSEKSPCIVNCVKAFITGGLICLIGELLATLYAYLGASAEDSLLFASLTLIFLTGLLTGIGIFDKIAKFGGGGALVPITGFANAMTAPPVDSKPEGLVNVAAKMFTIAGPVVVYGTAASVIYGIIYYLIVM